MDDKREKNCIQYDNRITLEEFRKLLKSAKGWEITASASDKQLKNAIENSMFISVAKEKEKVVGLARIVGDNSLKGMLCDVLILPDYQNRGIGKNIIKNIMQMVEDYLEVGEQFLLELCPVEETIEFYKKCGFIYDKNDMIGMSYRFIKK